MWRARAMERVRSRYSWDAVTDAYEKLADQSWRSSASAAMTELGRSLSRDRIRANYRAVRAVVGQPRRSCRW